MFLCRNLKVIFRIMNLLKRLTLVKFGNIVNNMSSYNYEQQYLALLKRVKETGVYSKNRTGINTYKVWGAQININLQDGFHLLTTKKMHWKSVVHELLWMIKGDTNIQYLLKNGVT